MPAMPVLKILAFAVLTYSLTSAPAVALISLGKQGNRARASALVLVFNAITASILIPAWGVQGAALAMVATFGLQAFLYTYLVRKITKRFFFDGRALAAMVLAVGGSAVVLLLKNLFLFLGFLGYAILGAVLFLAATTRGEKREIHRALRFQASGVPGAEP